MRGKLPGQPGEPSSVYASSLITELFHKNINKNNPTLWIKYQAFSSCSHASNLCWLGICRWIDMCVKPILFIFHYRRTGRQLVGTHSKGWTLPHRAKFSNKTLFSASVYSQRILNEISTSCNARHCTENKFKGDFCIKKKKTPVKKCTKKNMEEKEANR